MPLAQKHGQASVCVPPLTGHAPLLRNWGLRTTHVRNLPCECDLYTYSAGQTLFVLTPAHSSEAGSAVGVANVDAF